MDNVDDHFWLEGIVADLIMSEWLFPEWFREVDQPKNDFCLQSVMVIFREAKLQIQEFLMVLLL